jgi:transcriptional regulator with XRE-family HTH domain
VPGFGSPTIRLRLAAELHQLRERAALTGDQVAERLGWSPSKVSRIENARSKVTISDTKKLLALYHVEGKYRDELTALAREASRKGWWEAYAGELPSGLVELIGMEAEAESLWDWAPQLIPGLLQTEEYARSVIAGWQKFARITPSAIDSRVAARLARQRRLDDDAPLRVRAVMDESALYRRFGASSVMRSQLQHLIAISQNSNITIRILPFGGNHPVGTGSFVYLKFPQVYDIRLEDIVVLEQLTNSFVVNQDSEVYQYELAFEALFAESLQPAQSRDAIAKAIRDVWS